MKNKSIRKCLSFLMAFTMIFSTISFSFAEGLEADKDAVKLDKEEIELGETITLNFHVADYKPVGGDSYSQGNVEFYKDGKQIMDPDNSRKPWAIGLRQKFIDENGDGEIKIAIPEDLPEGYEAGEYKMKVKFGVFPIRTTIELPFTVKEAGQEPDEPGIPDEPSKPEVPEEKSDFEFDKGTGTITKYTGSSKNVTIPEEIDGVSVEIIGKDAFINKKLTSVEIPKSVTEIDTNAFKENDLTAIEFSGNLKKIGARAFANNKLKEVMIPDNVIEVGFNAFSDNELESAKISNKIEKINSYTFANNQLSEIDIPDSVKEIEACAFTQNQLIKVDIPDSVKIIGNSAFSKNQLEEVKLPNNIEKIAAHAFHTNKLTRIEIPYSLECIEYNVFANNELTKLTIPDNIKKIVGSSFAGNKLSQLTISDSVEEIGSSSFVNNELTEVKIPKELKNIEDEVFMNNKLKSITIPNGVAKIGKNAFANNNLESVSIPDKVEVIDWDAFANNELTEVYIPNNVKEIGYRAFKDNKILQGNVKIDNCEENVTIYNDAFKNNGDDGKTEITPVFLITLDFIFDKGTGTITKYTGSSKNVTIPEEIDGVKVKKIGSGVFASKELESVTILNGVEKIGERAFLGNQLKSVEIPDSVTYIDKLAFAGNELTNVKFSKILTSIGVEAFKDNKLEEVEIPNSVKNIDRSAFQNNKLTKANIPDNLEGIGYHAFANNQLEKVTIPGSLKKVDNHAFADNQIKELVIQDGVEILYWSAFANNQLTEVNIPSSVETIEEEAFSNNRILQGNALIDNHEKDVDIEEGAFYNNGTDGKTEITPIFLKDQVTVKNIKQIEGIEVDYGTSKEEVIEKLPTKVILNLSNGTKEEVDVIWTSEDYDGNKAGDYTFVGSYELPEGVIGEKPEVTVKVTVKEEPVPEVDRSKLEEILKSSEGVEKEGKTEESVKVLEEAISLGKEIFKNEKATQEEVDSALKSLVSAMEALEERPGELEVDKSELEEQIDIVRELEADDYTEESWSAFQEVVELAEAVLKNEEATQEEVDDALESLIEVLEELELKPDLITVVGFEEIEDMEVEFGTSKEDVLDILPEKVVLKLSNDTTIEVPVTWLNDEYDGNKSGEYIFIGEYELPEGVNRNILEFNLSIDNLESDILPKVKVIVKEEVVDKTELEAKIKEAKELKAKDYTEKTWSELEDSLTKAREVMANKTATQEEVNKTLELLKAAMNGLKVKPTDPKEPTNPVEPKDPKDEDDDKNSGVPTKPQTPNDSEKPQKLNKPGTINKPNNGTAKPNIQDKPIKTSLPKTGQSSMMWISILGAILLAIGIWINKRKQKEI